MKVSELEGAALDWAVANCEELVSTNTKNLFEPWYLLRDYTPSTDWAQAGPIIEREGIAIYLYGDGEWQAVLEKEYAGPTPLIASMRCYVASKLGDEVEVPEEVCDENL